jgi:nucleoid DNA-binding protein
MEEIARLLAEERDLGQTEALQRVHDVCDAIATVLAQEGRVQLTGFGSFEVKKRPARYGRNPRTGERLEIPEQVVVTFKAGHKLRERVAGREV